MTPKSSSFSEVQIAQHSMVLTMVLTELSASSPTSFWRLTFSTLCHFLNMSDSSHLCGPAHAAASTWNAVSLSSSWRIPTALLRPNATSSTRKQHLTQSGPQLPHSVQLADCLCCTAPCCYSIFYFTQQLYTATICFCVRLPVNCKLLQGGLHGCSPLWAQTVTSAEHQWTAGKH